VNGAEPSRMASPVPPRAIAGFAARAKAAGLNLVYLAVILAAVYFILGWWFTPLIVAILAAAILLPLAFPYRYEAVVSALTWLGIAALAWFYFGAQPLAVIAGGIGLISLLAAAAGLSRHASDTRASV
jgi:hypothetical protein